MRRVLKYLNIPESYSKLLLSFFSANFAVMLTQGITGIVVARIIDPVDMGIYLSTTIIITFLPILLLGVNNGLNRNSPLLIGQGESNRCIRMKDTAISYSIIVSFFVLIVITIIGIYFYYDGKIKLSYAFFATTIVSAVSPVSNVVEVTYKTSNDFIRLSKVKFYKVIISILTILLVYFFDYVGMLLRVSIVSSLYFYFLFLFKHDNFKFNFDLFEFKGLIKTGLPIAVISYIYAVYIGLDKIFILNYFGSDALGNYLPALHVTTALSVLPASIFQIIYPKLAYRYGKTNDINSLKNLVFRPQLILAFSLIPIIIIAIFCIDPFVNYVLPDYVDGILAAKWMIVVIYLRCLGGPQDILMITEDLSPYLICTLICAFIFWLLVYILKDVYNDFHIVPLSLAISTFIFNFIISCYVYLKMKNS